MWTKNTTYETNLDNGDWYWASFEDTSWTRGKTKKVYKGCIEGSGPRVGETVCVKIWRDTELTEEECDLEIEKASIAREIAMTFNDFNDQGIRKVNVIVPLKAALNTKASFHNLKIRERKLSRDEWVLIEQNIGKPFKGFQKRNGLTMEDGDNGTEAFMHFTYHQSQGNLVVCGLQGVSRRKSITISSPTIHSIHQMYGEMDDGMEGIKKVFENHTCNGICGDWLKPDRMRVPVAQNLHRIPSAPADDNQNSHDDTTDDAFLSNQLLDNTNSKKATSLNYDRHLPITLCHLCACTSGHDPAPLGCHNFANITPSLSPPPYEVFPPSYQHSISDNPALCVASSSFKDCYYTGSSVHVAATHLQHCNCQLTDTNKIQNGFNLGETHVSHLQSSF